MSNRIIKENQIVGKRKGKRNRGWYGRLRIVMAVLLMGELLLTSKSCVKVTGLILPFAENVLPEGQSFYETLWSFPMAAYLLVCAGFCLAQSWPARMIRTLLLLGNAVFWIILPKILIPLTRSLEGVMYVVYEYTGTGYVCAAISLIVAGCAMVTLKE